MDERRQIDLDRDKGEYVEVPKGPLDKPRTLNMGIAFFGFMSILAAAVAGHFAGWLWPFLVIPPAFMLGVAWVGRFPAVFFRRDRT